MTIRQSFFVPPPPFVLADEQGLLDGIDVASSRTTGSPAQLDGILAGELDVVVTAIDNLFEWTRAGADLRLVGQVEPTTPLGIYAASRFGSLAELTGSRFAVDALGNGFALVARVLLTRAGADVDFVEVGGVRERLDALLDGTVDATLLGPPFDAQASAAGQRVLGTVQQVFPEFPGQGLVVRADLVGTTEFERYRSALLAAGLLPVDAAGLGVLTGIRRDLGLLPADVDLSALIAAA